MTNSKFLILLILLTPFGIFGCRQEKGVEKRFSIDVTKPSKVSFIGMRGEKVNAKINGIFSGSIKFAMTGSANKLSDKDFAVFKDSISINIGMLNVYQDSTGFSWYIRPVDAKNGKVFITLTEYRK